MTEDRPGADLSRLTYSVEETARRLGVGRSSAYEAIRRGELPIIRVGRRLLVSRVALERMLEGETLAGQTDETH